MPDKMIISTASDSPHHTTIQREPLISIKYLRGTPDMAVP